MNAITRMNPMIFCVPGSTFSRIYWSAFSTDYSSPQAARVLMVAFWLSPYTAGALEESSLPEHRHFAPKTIRGTAVLADAFHVSFNMRKA